MITGQPTRLKRVMTAAIASVGVQPSIPTSPIPAVNVATVPQRSPLRYPGGKTWLVPHIRAWLGSIEPAPDLLIEPFAGGGIVSLTAVMEGLVGRCVMAEIDQDVAAFWQAALQHNDDLIAKVLRFIPTRSNVMELERQRSSSVLDRGFRTLVLNRTRRGGILADGASFNRSGENGKGVKSRWYPDTIVRRLEAVAERSGMIDFRETDGVGLLQQMLTSPTTTRAAIFADPPYTPGDKPSGRRLYNHDTIDHPRLFAILADSEAEFLMTYDESPEIMRLIRQRRFHVVRVEMKNTHHARRVELVITRRPLLPLLAATGSSRSS